jgi:hypothetical protein
MNKYIYIGRVYIWLNMDEIIFGKVVTNVDCVLLPWINLCSLLK